MALAGDSAQMLETPSAAAPALTVRNSRRLKPADLTCDIVSSKLPLYLVVQLTSWQQAEHRH